MRFQGALEMKAKTINSAFGAVALRAGLVLAPAPAVAGAEVEQAHPSRPAMAGSSYVKGFPRLLSGNGWETTIVLWISARPPSHFKNRSWGPMGERHPSW